MKYSILILLSFIGTLAIGQDKLAELYNEGIQYHDRGEYDKAIAKYEEALELSPDNPDLYYEIGYSYNMKGDNKNALKYYDKAIKYGTDRVDNAIMAKANVLDDMGKTKKALQLYEEAIEDGYTHYLMRFNYGIALYRHDKVEESKEQFKAALLDNFYHPSSHFFLGLISYNEDKKPEAAMSMLTFLTLENQSERAEKVDNILYSILDPKSAMKFDSTSNSYVINMNIGSLESPFAGASMMLVLPNFLDSTYDDADQMHRFLGGYTTFMRTIDVPENPDNYKGYELYFDRYVPYLKGIEENNHLEAFFYYSQRNFFEEAQTWLENNEEKLNAFAAWFQEYQKSSNP